MNAATGLCRGAKTLAIMPTFTCTAACTHCGTLSSPQERTQLALADILGAIDEARRLGFAVVVFTGGEATLRWKDLLTALTRARDHGLPTRLVTNAHWALDVEEADRKLRILIAAGLSEINYSTGDEHVRYVPLERVVHATVAAARLSLRTHIMIESTASRRVSRDDVLGHPLMASLSKEERARVTALDSPWMPLDAEQVERYGEGMTVNRGNVALRKGCDSVLQTYVVQADGRVGACCGLGLRLIPELNVTRTREQGFLEKAIVDSENDFLKVWLHYKGPEKILAWAAQHDPAIVWEDMYAHHCQACRRIYADPRVRAVIAEHYREIVAEVLQSAWIDEWFGPRRIRESGLRSRAQVANVPK
jgi:hypothetical protein